MISTSSLNKPSSESKCNAPASHSAGKPKAKPASKYEDLTCTSKDEVVIQEIISTVALKGKVSLLWNRAHLNHLGDQIRHVHSLKFLAAICTNEQSRSHIQVIFRDRFKRSGFMSEFGANLSKHLEEGTLNIYIEDFSKTVGAPVDQVQEYCTNREWQELVHFLTSDSKPK